nr:hypothetical protein [Tanacetum cinerariifolium]
MDYKKHILDLESFRNMLHICPRVQGSVHPKEKQGELALCQGRLLVLNDQAKATKAKSPSAPSEVARTEAQQLKIILKRSKKQTHISQLGGSGTDEGTGSKPRVLDVPTDESEEELSWNS